MGRPTVGAGTVQTEVSAGLAKPSGLRCAPTELPETTDEAGTGSGVSAQRGALHAQPCLARVAEPPRMFHLQIHFTRLTRRETHSAFPYPEHSERGLGSDWGAGQPGQSGTAAAQT